MAERSPLGAPPATAGSDPSHPASANGIRMAPPPRVVGIDDGAWRKGQRYGTIVVDLKRGDVKNPNPGEGNGRRLTPPRPFCIIVLIQ
jgi:hypothetical protein